MQISILLFPEKNHVRADSFRNAIGFVCIIAQFFGIMPVIGVRRRCVTELKFKWLHLPTIYSLFMSLILLSYSSWCFWKAFTKPIDFPSIGKTNELHH